jgi:hypothetical protein
LLRHGQGRPRTHLIDRHLRAHLEVPPQQLVDAGGGAGHQALPLARDGYRVTIVEPSEAMLERAEGLLADEPAAVRERVTLVMAAGESPDTTGWQHALKQNFRPGGAIPMGRRSVSLGGDPDRP